MTRGDKRRRKMYDVIIIGSGPAERVDAQNDSSSQPW